MNFSPCCCLFFTSTLLEWIWIDMVGRMNRLLGVGLSLWPWWDGNTGVSWDRKTRFVLWLSLINLCMYVCFYRKYLLLPVNGWHLTHWGRDKIAAIFQSTVSNGFSWMKMYEFRLKFVPKGPINNIPALVQIMAWRRPGAKPLSEPMMVRLLTHIWVTRPQWVKALQTHVFVKAFRSLPIITNMSYW